MPPSPPRAWFVAVCRRAVLVISEGECPHPRRTNGRGGDLQDAADDSAIGQHIVVVVVPLARGARGGCAFERQVVGSRHSITSSARASRVGGTSRPSACGYSGHHGTDRITVSC